MRVKLIEDFEFYTEEGVTIDKAPQAVKFSGHLRNVKTYFVEYHAVTMAAFEPYVEAPTFYVEVYAHVTLASRIRIAVNRMMHDPRVFTGIIAMCGLAIGAAAYFNFTG